MRNAIQYGRIEGTVLPRIGHKKRTVWGGRRSARVSALLSVIDAQRLLVQVALRMTPMRSQSRHRICDSWSVLHDIHLQDARCRGCGWRSALHANHCPRSAKRVESFVAAGKPMRDEYRAKPTNFQDYAGARLRPRRLLRPCRLLDLGDFSALRLAEALRSVRRRVRRPSGCAASLYGARDRFRAASQHCICYASGTARAFGTDYDKERHLH